MGIGSICTSESVLASVSFRLLAAKLSLPFMPSNVNVTADATTTNPPTDAPTITSKLESCAAAGEGVVEGAMLVVPESDESGPPAGEGVVEGGILAPCEDVEGGIVGGG